MRMKLTPGSFIPQSPHFGAVPFFLMCCRRSFPPGVLMMRTLFERVLYLFGGFLSMLTSRLISFAFGALTDCSVAACDCHISYLSIRRRKCVELTYVNLVTILTSEEAVLR